MDKEQNEHNEPNCLNNKVLHLENITRSFVQGNTVLNILKETSLSIARGEIVALVGPSGSGKSTLLQIAGLLEPPDTGKITIEDLEIDKTTDNIRTRLRRDKIGFVYQFHHLLPDFTALENLTLPQMIAGKKKASALSKSAMMLEKVGLKDRMHHLPSELSGGEQQRVAIARALANDPILLLADEPTGNLDPETAAGVFNTLIETARSAGLGALIATHDRELARKMDRILTLSSGQV